MHAISIHNYFFCTFFYIFHSINSVFSLPLLMADSRSDRLSSTGFLNSNTIFNYFYRRVLLYYIKRHWDSSNSFFLTVKANTKKRLCPHSLWRNNNNLSSFSKYMYVNTVDFVIICLFAPKKILYFVWIMIVYIDF